jgi:hypothetical protein
LNTVYTVTVRGGASDPRVKDLAGNALATNDSWSFTTTAVNVQTYTLWPNTATPGNASDNGTSPVELGLKFRSDVAGRVTGVRFFKGPTNTGTHIGRLWTAAGGSLGEVTFINETASGWQQAFFGSPIDIQPNTTYVVSYFAPNGGYAYDANYFTTNGVDNGVLHAPNNAAASGNGVYLYAPTGGFPNNTFGSANYWVDVIFDTVGGSPSDSVAPTATITSPVNAANYEATSTPLSLGGTSNDNVGVTQVTWSNDRGGSGVATGTAVWSTRTGEGRVRTATSACDA